jgi:hypothetical protein
MKLHLPRKYCVNNAYIGIHKNLTDGLIAASTFREAFTDGQTWPTYEALRLASEITHYSNVTGSSTGDEMQSDAMHELSQVVIIAEEVQAGWM